MKHSGGESTDDDALFACGSLMLKGRRSSTSERYCKLPPRSPDLNLCLMVHNKLTSSVSSRVNSPFIRFAGGK